MDLWRLWTTAKSLGQRPSQLIGLTRPADGWLAACFDTSCVTFGRWVDSRLVDLDDEGRPRFRLADLLTGPPARKQDTAGRYRSPRELMGGGQAATAEQGAGWAQTRKYRSPGELIGGAGQNG